MFSKSIVVVVAVCVGCASVPKEMSCIKPEYNHGNETYQITSPITAVREDLNRKMGLSENTEVLAYFTSTKGNWHIYTYEEPLTGKRLSLQGGKKVGETTWVCLVD